MLILLTSTNQIVTAVEGTGDNLTPEDEAQGYVDYIMSSVYGQEGDQLEEYDGGQILTTKLVQDMTELEFAKTVLEFWGAEKENFTIITNERGQI